MKLFDSIYVNLQHNLAQLVKIKHFIKLFFVWLLCSNTNIYAQSTDDFVTVWDMSNSNYIEFNYTTNCDANYTWESVPFLYQGSGTLSGSGTTSILVTRGGKYRLRISNCLTTFNFYDENISNINTIQSDRLQKIEQWGSSIWSNLNLSKSLNLKITAIDIPNLSNLENTNFMFDFCQNIDSIHNISLWKINKIKSMNAMFLGVANFNEDIGDWNVSQVRDMSSMFNSAPSFNQNIGRWDIHNVNNLSNMFLSAINFNQNIDNWNTSNVTVMSGMFAKAKSFNKDIGSWNTTKVENMSYMFSNATNFNVNIGNWDLSKNKDISYMFDFAQAFDHDLKNWNVEKIVSFEGLFNNAISFNQDISNWNISNGIYMSYMFSNAKSFDQSLEKWGTKLNPNVDLRNFLDNSGLSTANYDATLIGFSNTTVTNRIMGAAGLKYCSAASARDHLINNLGWTIVGDSFSSTPSLPTFSFGTTLTICSGAMTILPSISGNGFKGSWSHSVVNNTLSGSYTFIPQSSCGTTTSISVVISNDLPTSIISQPVSKNFCPDQNAQFSISASGSNISYLWNTGETTQSITKSVAGSFFATVSGTCGKVVSETATNSVLPLTSITSQPISQTICQNQNAQFSVSALGSNLKYKWSNNNSNSNLMQTSVVGLNYTVSVSGDCGFEVSKPFSVSLSDEAVIITNLPTQISSICYDVELATTITNPKNNYLWNTGETNPKLKVSKSGIYILKTSNSCTQKSDTIDIKIENPAEKIPNIITPNGDNSNEYLEFSGCFFEKSPFEIQVFNRWGTLVFKTNAYKNNWNAENLPDGIYFYTITSSSNLESKSGWVQVLR